TLRASRATRVRAAQGHGCGSLTALAISKWQPWCSRPRGRGLLGGVGGEGAAAGFPFLLDAAEVPDGQGDDPGEDEHPDDEQAGGVDVERLHERPERAVEAGVL